jgi:hypothetical protein
VNGAVIDIGAEFRKRIRVAIIGIERLGFEYVGIARNDMGNIIMVRPCDCRPSSDLVELVMNGENRLCIKRRGAAEATGMALATPAARLGLPKFG